jgi:hypothetical protein
MGQRNESESRAGGRAQPPVYFDCQPWLTMPMEYEMSKSAGGEHAPPPGGFRPFGQAP